jgi:hypothetical protein
LSRKNAEKYSKFAYMVKPALDRLSGARIGAVRAVVTLKIEMETGRETWNAPGLDRLGALKRGRNCEKRRRGTLQLRIIFLTDGQIFSIFDFTWNGGC